MRVKRSPKGFIKSDLFPQRFTLYTTIDKRTATEPCFVVAAAAVEIMFQIHSLSFASVYSALCI